MSSQRIDPDLMQAARDSVARGDLLEWFRENWQFIVGSKAEWVRIIAAHELKRIIDIDEIGEAFLTVDAERRKLISDEEFKRRERKWQRTRAEDMPDAQEVHDEQAGMCGLPAKKVRR